VPDPAPAPAPLPDPVPAPLPAPAPADPPKPDNTGVNVRDTDPDAKTPEAQENNDRALKITATIRKRITDAPGMSINARNIKIITANATVTLRGPVTTAEEKSRIEQFAKEAAGDFKVENLLEVP
jgi:osmotically-inducible protein OsmY